MLVASSAQLKAEDVRENGTGEKDEAVWDEDVAQGWASSCESLEVDIDGESIRFCFCASRIVNVHDSC